MNKLKPIITLLVLTFFSFGVFAQTESKDVSITASGSGKTLEDAKQAALRSCIEQAFGAFVSSKTEMFNDHVVADQMASVSSGNIKSFEILNQDQMPDERWGVTLRAIVSIDRLTSFVQAKGIAIEVKGGMFALNIKQQLLNEQGEIKAVAEMVGLLHESMQISFDFEIKSSDPKSLDAESKNWEIPLLVTVTCNENMDFCANYFINTLAALSLPINEVETYKSLGKIVFPIDVTYKNQTLTYYLRKKSSVSAIQSLTSNWEFYTRLFSLQSGMDESFGNGKNGLEFLFADYYGAISINYPTNGQQVATFSWNDKRTLAEIEQMTGYSVRPRGVVSNFKYGGFVMSELDRIGTQLDSLKGVGFVIAVCDVGSYNFTDAETVCDELALNGYNDWRLPSLDELKIIFNYTKGLGVELGLEKNQFYWSSSKCEGWDGYYAFECSRAYKESFKYSSINGVRAVRFISPQVQVDDSKQQSENSNLEVKDLQIQVFIDFNKNVCRLGNDASTLKNIIDFDFRIFDRYGEKWFATKDPNFIWNLKSEGLYMVAGKYSYQITYRIKGGVEFNRINGSFDYVPPRH